MRKILFGSLIASLCIGFAGCSEEESIESKLCDTMADAFANNSNLKDVNISIAGQSFIFTANSTGCEKKLRDIIDIGDTHNCKTQTEKWLDCAGDLTSSELLQMLAQELSTHCSGYASALDTCMNDTQN